MLNATVPARPLESRGIVTVWQGLGRVQNFLRRFLTPEPRPAFPLALTPTLLSF